MSVGSQKQVPGRESILRKLSAGRPGPQHIALSEALGLQALQEYPVSFHPVFGYGTTLDSGNRTIPTTRNVEQRHGWGLAFF